MKNITTILLLSAGLALADSTHDTTVTGGETTINNNPTVSPVTNVAVSPVTNVAGSSPVNVNQNKFTPVNKVKVNPVNANRVNANPVNTVDASNKLLNNVNSKSQSVSNALSKSGSSSSSAAKATGGNASPTVVNDNHSVQSVPDFITTFDYVAWKKWQLQERPLYSHTKPGATISKQDVRSVQPVVQPTPSTDSAQERYNAFLRDKGINSNTVGHATVINGKMVVPTVEQQFR